MKDGFFFVGIFILLFVVWVASGGPSRPISFAGPYLSPIHTTGATAQPYGDPTKFSSINSSVTVGAGGVSVANTAPAAGAVTLSRDTSGAASSDPDEEYVIVSVSAGASGTISTAGWKLMSRETGEGALFPQGTEVPRSGRVNVLSPIVLHPGDQAIVATGRSPVGISFRENACTGYFEEHQDFHPALSMSCPTPSQEYATFYEGSDRNDACLSYVRSIPYCGTETRSSTDVPNSCESFVDEHLNYNGCADAHAKDAGFLGTTWRIFLGSRSELWKRSRETIVLLDAQNKVIDSLSY